MSEATQLKRFSQSPDPDALFAHLVRNYPEVEYYSVYEAGFCGFWIHYRLVGLGIQNVVVNPTDVPTTTGEKLRKTDVIDNGKLARSLCAGELKGIYVPGSESLEMRSLIRLRASITKDQTRQKNRIKSYLRYLCAEIPQEFSDSGHCWNSRFIVWLKGAETSTAYGLNTLDFLVRQYETLRSQGLEIPAIQAPTLERDPACGGVHHRVAGAAQPGTGLLLQGLKVRVWSVCQEDLRHVLETLPFDPGSAGRQNTSLKGRLLT